MFNELNILNSQEIEQKIIDFMSINKIQLQFIKKIDSFQVVRYFFKISNNAKINKIKKIVDELQLYIQASKIKLDIDNLSGCIVFEVAKNTKDILYFDSLKDTQVEGLSALIGQDVNKNNIYIDFTKAPHLLIAGTTGSGKSSIINNILKSLTNKYTSDFLKIILIDIKKVEFSKYNNSPFLATPVITEVEKAISILNKICQIMDNRYKNLSSSGKLNYYLIVIDEFSDLILQSKEVEKYIIRLAQLGRACGIHLLIATQRPCRETITGLIKANIPTRLALTVTSLYDSKIILDTIGAEKLTGAGDFLLKKSNGDIVRGQAALIERNL